MKWEFFVIWFLRFHEQQRQPPTQQPSTHLGLGLSNMNEKDMASMTVSYMLLVACD
jgi:hypothetical protein